MIVVAGGTEVGRSEAEEHGQRAAEAALKGEEFAAVMNARLGTGRVGARAAHELRRIDVIERRSVDFLLAPGGTAVIRFAALVTHVVCVLFHRRVGQVDVPG